jgi:hypothetical protein
MQKTASAIAVLPLQLLCSANSKEKQRGLPLTAEQCIARRMRMLSRIVFVYAPLRATTAGANALALETRAIAAAEQQVAFMMQEGGVSRESNAHTRIVGVAIWVGDPHVSKHAPPSYKFKQARLEHDRVPAQRLLGTA